MQETAASLAGKIAVVQVNSDNSPKLAERYGVRGIPAVHLLKNGKTVDSFSGAMNAQSLLAWVKRHLA